jgi:hypothetical protein
MSRNDPTPSDPLAFNRPVTIKGRSFIRSEEFQWEAYGIARHRVEAMIKERTVCHLDVMRKKYGEPVDKETGLRLDGPYFEEYVERGYRAEDYPPPGYAERPSRALTAFREEQKAVPATEPPATEPPATEPPADVVLEAPPVVESLPEPELPPVVEHVVDVVQEPEAPPEPAPVVSPQSVSGPRNTPRRGR